MPRIYPEHPIPAVAGLIFKDDSILLIRRNKPPSEGKWSFPGGAVQLGESLEAALMREIAEETGLAVKTGPLVSALSKVNHDERGDVEYHYVLLDFLCEVEGGKPVAGSDAAGIKWVKLNEIGDLRVTEGLNRIINEAQRIRRKLLVKGRMG